MTAVAIEAAKDAQAAAMAKRRRPIWWKHALGRPESALAETTKQADSRVHPDIAEVGSLSMA
jgi:hypothetical protein